MSKIKVNSIEAATGSTITIPSGQTLDISSTTLTLPSTVVTTTGSQTLTNKTIGVSQLSGTLPVANGGTGLTTLGSATQVLRVNSGATALEFATITSSNVKAWVNFDGTGTPSIRASLNVSSITDNGTADYTVNFTNALTDANYAVAGDGATSGTTLDAGNYNRGPTLCNQALNSSSFRIRTSQLWTTTPEDLGLITYIVTR
jgi:hypothetical protein